MRIIVWDIDVLVVNNRRAKIFISMHLNMS